MTGTRTASSVETTENVRAVHESLSEAQVVNLVGGAGIGKTWTARRAVAGLPAVEWIDLSWLPAGEWLPLARSRARAGGSNDATVVLDDADLLAQEAAGLVGELTRSGGRVVLTGLQPVDVGGAVLRIRPLDAMSSGALLRSLLGLGPENQRTEDAVLGTGGLPLAIELLAGVAATSGLDESVRSLDRHLSRTSPWPGAAMSSQRRMELVTAWALDEVERQCQPVLVLASVFPHTFTPGGLDELTEGLVPSAVRRVGLEVLRRRRLVMPAASGRNRFQVPRVVRHASLARADAELLSMAWERHRRRSLALARDASDPRIPRGWAALLDHELPDLVHTVAAERIDTAATWPVPSVHPQGLTQLVEYLSPEGLSALTPTERQVVRLAVDGLANPGIAAALSVSRNTVKTHLSAAYRKLGVTKRTELASACDDGQGGAAYAADGGGAAPLDRTSGP